jgi:hypothetical protein
MRHAMAGSVWVPMVWQEPPAREGLTASVEISAGAEMPVATTTLHALQYDMGLLVMMGWQLHEA